MFAFVQTVFHRQWFNIVTILEAVSNILSTSSASEDRRHTVETQEMEKSKERNWFSIFYLVCSHSRPVPSQHPGDSASVCLCVPFRSDSHLMPLELLIYNSAPFMFTPQRKSRGGVQCCQNNLIHSVWTEQLLFLTSIKIRITLSQGPRFPWLGEESWWHKKKDGCSVGICQGPRGKNSRKRFSADSRTERLLSVI